MQASMQELIRRRKRAGFVGRRGELAAFQRNFDVPVDDEQHRFVYSVHGNAGVGKTFLVRELEQAARERGAVTAYTDEGVNSVPEALGAIGAHFARQGHPLKALDRILATYRQRRYEAEAAGAGPGPGPSAGAVVAAQAGLAGIGLVPGVGALAGAVDPAQLAQGADRLRAALSARLGRQEDVQLVLDPLRVLTPVFVEELGRVAAQVPWVALFFDTYELTGAFLDGWLRDLVSTDRYGGLPANTVLTLSGQGRHDPLRWPAAADFVADLPLEPFTEDEARQLLAAKGVVEEDVVRDVLRLSGRLPVLVSTLAGSRPATPGDIGDPSATAVERFLKWEPDPVRRAAALEGALPRRLDEDVFRAAVSGDAAGLFGWLRSLPFVRDQGGRIKYHEVVRAPMQRLQRTSSPQRWRAGHQRLAAWYARERAAAEGASGERWRDEAWREPRLEELYHRLCADPAGTFGEVLRDGIAACRQGTVTARRWARVIADAGEDANREPLRTWGTACLAALAAERGQCVDVLGMMLARPELTDDDRVAVHVARAWGHFRAEAYEEALADHRRALTLHPRSADAHHGRAVLHRALGDHAAALADLDRLEELEPGLPRAPRERGETHRRAGRYEEAVAELGRALALDPADALTLGSRGQALAQLDRPTEALEDFDRALAIDPDYGWALVRRAHVRALRGDTEGALADLDRAERLSPSWAWVLGERGLVYRFAGRFEEAVEQFGRALRLDPGYAWALGSRAVALAELGRVTEALADLDRAVEMVPGYVWAYQQRARLHRSLGREEHALADLARAERAGHAQGIPSGPPPADEGGPRHPTAPPEPGPGPRG
ncbi:tetratricopeptide repeat protein [Streptomyces sp. NBC_01431]|uniref:tetratricopeptide repeat protein n=1 Tax=Streptomyces sp. NBC_01431 TaxID=2903863 RepID=UPI002E302A9A|nr:tetratricopeptide repeat protein [Streptomyces sp. NBC_01431]